MSGFQIPGTNRTVSYLDATQQHVPGEPIFVMVRDDLSTEAENVQVVTVTTLDWMREQTYTALEDARSSWPDYLELYVLFPTADDFPTGLGLTRVNLGTVAGKEPGDGPRLALSNEIGILWSCDL